MNGLGSFDANAFGANFQRARDNTTQRKIGEALSSGSDTALNDASQIAYKRGAVNIGSQLQTEYKKQLATMSEADAKKSAEGLKRLGGVASALSGVPAAQRLQVVQQSPILAKAISELGIEPTQLTLDHLSDESLTAIQGLAQGADQFNSDSLARRQQSETERAALVDENQGQQGIDLNVRKQDFTEGAEHDLNVRQEDRLDNTLQETRRSNRADERIRGAANEIDRLEAKAKATGATPDIKDVLKIKGDFEREAKTFEQAQRQFLTMENLKNDQTGASDVALGFAFFKTIDPTSTVREGEFASAAGALGVGGRIQGMLQKLDDGQKFTPQLREDLVNAARQAFEQQKTDIQALAQRTGEFSERYGIPATDVSRNPVRSNPAAENPSGPKEGDTATNPQTGQKAVFTGGQWKVQ